MDASEKTKLEGTSNPKNEDIFPTAPGSIAIAKKPILITSQNATYFSYSFRCRTHQAPNNNADRRSFLRNAAVLSLGVPAALVVTNEAKANEATSLINEHIDHNSKQAANEFSILITTDLHAQINTHDEFFWENGQAVYKRRGGLAVLKTMIDTLRKENPNNILYDGGDYFHGHAIASITEGEALIPLMNAFNYDLILPGNWEVVYKKKKMLLEFKSQLHHEYFGDFVLDGFHSNFQCMKKGRGFVESYKIITQYA